MARSLWDETYLDLIRLLKDAECRIDRQKLLIQSIRARGQDSTHADELLGFFETVRSELRRNLTAMELAQERPSGPVVLPQKRSVN